MYLTTTETPDIAFEFEDKDIQGKNKLKLALTSVSLSPVDLQPKKSYREVVKISWNFSKIDGNTIFLKRERTGKVLIIKYTKPLMITGNMTTEEKKQNEDYWRKEFNANKEAVFSFLTS